MKRKFTDQQLIEAVETSTSFRQVFSKIGLIPAGGNYYTTKKYIEKLGLDTSHFKGQGWLKDKNHDYRKKSLQDYLSNKFSILSYKLKLRLIKEGIFKSVCSNCGLEKWLDKSIPLELHHINGQQDDNTLSNLQLLCPNCHAFTPNYRGKNKS